MGPTERLLQQFSKHGHILARSIDPKEVPHLIEALRQRLTMSSEELDLSPASLKRLEQRLCQCFQSMQAEGNLYTDEDLLQMVREITAYVGEVLVKQAGARWGDQPKTLWGSEVIVDGPWKVVKGHQYTSAHPTHFVIGSTAAWAWDTIVAGKKPNLYRLYREAHTKRLRERTPKVSRIKGT